MVILQNIVLVKTVQITDVYTESGENQMVHRSGDTTGGVVETIAYLTVHLVSVILTGMIRVVIMRVVTMGIMIVCVLIVWITGLLERYGTPVQIALLLKFLAGI